MKDKIQHFLFGLTSMLVSLWLYEGLPLWKAVLPAVWSWIFLEMVQADAFGYGVRWFLRRDTWLDLAADCGGGAVPLIVFYSILLINGGV